MANDTASYKCPACGAPLVYSTDSGQLRCHSCGNKYDVETARAFGEANENNGEFDWGDYKKNFKDTESRMDETSVYVCRSCGAVVETDAGTAASHCPYCDNEIVITDRLSGGIRPNGIIPFEIDKNSLKDAVKRFAKHRFFLPNDFFSSHKLDSVRGVYVPFWLFSAGVSGRISLDGRTVSTYSDSDYIYTKTSHYLINVDGGMEFSRVPVDGSEKFDNDLMDAIEPFDYSKLTEFNAGYLSGFLADRFDEDPDKSLPRASERMLKTALERLRTAVGHKFSSISIRSSALKLSDTSVKYVLLPAYLIIVRYKDKDYRFCVNGQTGKMVGELPISKAKKRLFFWSITGVVGLVVSFLTFLVFR